MSLECRIEERTAYRNRQPQTQLLHCRKNIVKHPHSTTNADPGSFRNLLNVAVSAYEKVYLTLHTCSTFIRVDHQIIKSEYIMGRGF